MTDEQKKLVVQAAKQLKNSAYGATAVKIELEGRLYRSDPGSRRPPCRECEGDEFVDHAECEGSGRIEYDPELHAASDRLCTECSPESCDNASQVQCSGCDGDGRVRCPRECDGRETDDASDMEEGDWQDTVFCQDWMLKYLRKYGLAREIDGDEEEAERRSGDYGEWRPDGPLRYFYLHTDISVDTECTATLMITNPEDILLLPKLIEAWNALGRAVGNGVGTDNAGLHLALINDPDGTYDEDAGGDAIRYRNFRRSMSMLLPALYFLGATCENTRSMHFREPRVSAEKYSAIHYIGTTLEFRVFDTCYDNPDQVLDNFVVMRNCMRYWSKVYIAPKLSKTIKQLDFGVDGSSRIDRLYNSTTHIEILNAGLRKLKPSYRTIKEIKRQRKFTLHKGKFSKRERDARKQAVIEYREYEDRFDFKMKQVYHSWAANYLTEQLQNIPKGKYKKDQEQTLTLKARQQARTVVKRETARKKTLDTYVQEKVDQLLNRNQGSYTLSET